MEILWKSHATFVDHGQQIWFYHYLLETLYMYFMYELHNHHYRITNNSKKYMLNIAAT